MSGFNVFVVDIYLLSTNKHQRTIWNMFVCLCPINIRGLCDSPIHYYSLHPTCLSLVPQTHLLVSPILCVLRVVKWNMFFSAGPPPYSRYLSKKKMRKWNVVASKDPLQNVRMLTVITQVSARDVFEVDWKIIFSRSARLYTFQSLALCFLSLVLF